MEDKMDGVAEVDKKVRLLAERVLPGRPHHLTLNPNRKYPSPPGFWFTGQSSRLQYLTNLSDADRGMLLTVPFFEIMDEPDEGTPAPAKVAQKGEAKKKMSMKDYKARKTSPTEGEQLVKADAKQVAAATDASAPKENEKRKSEDGRSKETNGHPAVEAEKAPEKARPEQNGERYVGSQPFGRHGGRDQRANHLQCRTALPSKNEVKNPPPQDSRKRPPDPDENSAAPKKLKANDGTPVADKGGEEKPSTQRSRDAPKEKPVLKEPRDGRDSRDAREPREAKDARDAKDSRDAKDAKPPAPSGTTNGRLQVSSDRDRDSPRSTIMVNGAASRTGSSTSTPRKADKGDGLKANIPPLLSPPFQMDTNDDLPSPRKKPAGKAPLKGPKLLGHSRTNSATKPALPDLLSPIHMALDDDNDSPAKKPQEKSKLKVPLPSSKPPKRRDLKSLIPPLLSPTLPAIVEEDLARNPVKVIPLSQAAGAAKKPKSKPAPDSRPAESKPPERKGLLEPKPRPEDPVTRSRIVTLKVRKSLRARVQAILSLPSKSRRDALRKDRSASVERTPPARKRPLPPPDAASDAPASKRSRPSLDARPPSRPTAPTTPVKTTSTSMMRVLSNTSQANTPGDSTTTLTPGTAEGRPPTSSAAENNSNSTISLDPAMLARSATHRDRHAKYSKLGSKLKHTRDAILRNTRGAPTEAESKRCTALHFEMVLAYMVAFKAHNAMRQAERKPCDFAVWESLLPHIGELRGRANRHRALLALLQQMHALILEEFCQTFMTLDDRAAGQLWFRWVKYAKRRREVWEDAHALSEKVAEQKLKAPIGPWTPTEDAVSAALLVIRRWAGAEGVDWKAELDMGSSQ
ncbi:hypothetical protein GE09DRAFT_38485 [Coniochaeta sp. 2T2.1]|nr:hypothetical protein GE09DRAFT_38485 [Coniochaeta sp. 2T2.1]